MYGKSNMETYITVCKIDSQGEFAVWLRKQGLCINLEWWDGEGYGWQGAGDQPRLIQGIRRRDGVGEDQETTA